MKKQIKVINNFELNKLIKTNYHNFYIDGIFNIYNIEEFKKKIKSNINDIKQILVEAYIKYGVNIFKYLKGDWLIILYNKTEDCIVVIKDQSSHIPFFFYHFDNIFLGGFFLNDIIRSKYFIPILNKNMLLNELLRIHLGNETAYKNTYILKCNNYLKLKGNKLIVEKYEKKEIKKIKYKNDIDYFEHFDELFTNAVKRRINSNLGVFLSSGLDSTSILVKILENTNNKINTYTSVPKYEVKNSKRNTNERYLVELLVDKYKERINANYINSYKTKIIDSLNLSLKIHPEPMPWAINFYWINDLYKQAQKDNIKTIIKGGIGNLTISKTFNDIRFYHNTKLYFKYKLLKQKNNHIFNKYVSFNTKIDLFFKLIFSHKNYDNILSINNIYGMRAFSIAQYYNINNMLPANDIDIINFFNSLPCNILFNQKYGNRPFVTYNMRNKIPSEILFYKKRGLQASDMDLRIEDEKKELQNIFLLGNNKKYKNIKRIFNVKNLHLLEKYPRLILFLLFLLKNKNYGMD